MSRAARQDPTWREADEWPGRRANPKSPQGRARRLREDSLKLSRVLNMVFITTGSGRWYRHRRGAYHRFARQRNGALTVAVVTKPFGFEGKRRMQRLSAAWPN